MESDDNETTLVSGTIIKLLVLRHVTINLTHEKEINNGKGIKIKSYTWLNSSVKIEAKMDHTLFYVTTLQ